MSKVLKIIIIVLVIGALAFVGLSMFSDTGNSNTGGSLQSLNTGNSVNTGSLAQTTTTQSSVDTEQINREFVSMLLNLDAIKLNDDIFSEPAFSVLRDNSIRLNQPGNEGRPNPFAPIGIDRVQTSASAASALGGLSTENTSEDNMAETQNVSNMEQNAAETGSDGTLSDEQIQDIFSTLGSS